MIDGNEAIIDMDNPGEKNGDRVGYLRETKLAIHEIFSELLFHVLVPMAHLVLVIRSNTFPTDYTTDDKLPDMNFVKHE